MPKKSKYTFLQNGCYRTELSVTPANWHTKAARTNKPWMIWYRFYDPNSAQSPKLVKIRGMNQFHDLAQRQQQTRIMLDGELDLLDVQGYNPISKEAVIQVSEPQADEDTLSPSTRLMPALALALGSRPLSRKTRQDIKSKLTHVKVAAEQLGYGTLKISEVRRKHIRALMDQLGKAKKEKWTANNFNRYRTDLGILFDELNELEAMDVNPVHGIRKKKRVKAAPREVLTPEEIVKVDAHLRTNYYTFWRFLEIFFEASCRETELLAVELEHVDLKRRRFRVLTQKGASSRWIWKAINNRVLPLWSQLIQSAESLPQSAGRLFLFAEDLSPMWRESPIRQEQISRRWNMHVKKKLGISADFYSLKHLKTTMLVDALAKQSSVPNAQKIAAEQNGHTSTSMVVQIYDVKAEERKLKELQTVSTPLISNTGGV